MAAVNVVWGSRTLAFATTGSGATLPCPNGDGTLTLTARQVAGLDPVTHVCGYRHDIDVYTHLVLLLPQVYSEFGDTGSYPDGYPPPWSLDPP